MGDPAGATKQNPAAAAPPYLGIRTIGLTVTDLDATIGFYAAAALYAEVKRYRLAASAFGAELLTDTGGEVEIALIAVPTGFLQLMTFAHGPVAPAEPLGVPGPGYTHICFQSPASDPALVRFMRAGLGLISRCDENGVDLGGYGVRYAYGRDPEGRMIEVEVLDRPHRGEPAWVAHLANTVHDHRAMLDFYARLTGAPARRVIEQSSRPTYDAVTGLDGTSVRAAWFAVGNLELEVWQYLHPPTPAPIGRRRLDEIGYNAPAFETADLDVERARLGGLGIPLIGPELDLGGWRSQYAADPEGNLFCVQQRTTAPAAESVARA